MSQTTYSTILAAAKEGMLADLQFAGKDVQGKVASGLVRLGILSVLDPTLPPGPGNNSTPSTGGVKTIPVLAATVADLLAVSPASAAVQTIAASSAAKLSPARRLQVTLNNHANWLASTIELHGENLNGDFISETLVVPAGGNVVQTTRQYFGRFIEVIVPAEGGAAATLSIGVTANDGLYGAADSGIALFDASREPYTALNEYSDKDPLPWLKKGRVWVAVENATNDGDPAYVRMVVSGNNVRGQFTGGAPVANFSPYPRGVFRSKAAGGALAILELV